MKYLLDTNVLISLFKNKYGIRDAILTIGRRECVISTLTIGELLVGAYKGKDSRQKNEVEKTKELFQQFRSAKPLSTYMQRLVQHLNYKVSA